MQIHPTAAKGFEAAADAYERARPGYPAEAVDWLVSRLAVGPGTTVVDLAAGTGKLTRLLVPTGARVIGVEPVAAMRAKLSTVVPEAEAVEGTAEQIPLGDGSVDALTVAQAFQWFRAEEALAEMHRVLRPGGGIGLVWNRRDMSQPVNQELDALLNRHRGETPHHRNRNWREAFRRTALFGPLEERSFPSHQLLDMDGVVDRIVSLSFVATLDKEPRDVLISEIRELVARYPLPVRLDYVTEVHTCRRS